LEEVERYKQLLQEVKTQVGGVQSMAGILSDRGAAATYQYHNVSASAGALKPPSAALHSTAQHSKQWTAAGPTSAGQRNGASSLTPGTIPAAL
jgi:hypothetical protein